MRLALNPPAACAPVGAMLGALELDLQGMQVLELGPGRGDALAVFRGLGASCSFVERHPGYYLLNRLLGFDGRLGNFLDGPLPSADLTYLRGSITDSYFADEETARLWLESLPGLSVIAPWWPGSLRLDAGSALETLVGRAACAAGFEAVKIPLLNTTTIYPVTFVGPLPDVAAGIAGRPRLTRLEVASAIRARASGRT